MVGYIGVPLFMETTICVERPVERTHIYIYIRIHIYTGVFWNESTESGRIRWNLGLCSV